MLPTSLFEQLQINTLREKCDNAKERIWIAVPFIGAIKDIYRIIGDHWQLSNIDFRVMTDIDMGFLGDGCFDAFSTAGAIRSLRGLHSKIYIVDDWCLVTSANLTRTAFEKRFEMGIAQDKCPEVVNQFQIWWKSAKDVTKPPKQKNKISLADYEEGCQLQSRFKLPKYSVDDKHNYESTCAKYDDFAKLYASVVTRDNMFVNNGYTLYQEVDCFFNYLFHDHYSKPSSKGILRNLDNNARKQEIRKYYRQMMRDYGDDAQLWRVKNSTFLQDHLTPENISRLTINDVEAVVNRLQCYVSLPLNKTMLINPKNNKLKDILDCWRDLLFDEDITNEVIIMAEKSLKYFGYSAVRELVGWRYPDKYPVINTNSLAGLKFFGYNVKK